jgi:hypothetical protein
MSTTAEGITLTLRHSPDEGMLPLICPDTGRSLRAVIADLQSLLDEGGIALTFEETVAALPPGRMRLFLINERPLEAIVAPRIPRSPCAGCPCCGEESSECGECGDAPFWDEIPESVIRLAVLKVAGLKQ